MRRNAEQFKLKFARTWEDDGTARQEIRRFLHNYTQLFVTANTSVNGLYAQVEKRFIKDKFI